MPKHAKVEKVEELKSVLVEDASFVLTDYRSLKVGEMAELRRRLRPRGIEYHVVKNTLLTLAVAQRGLPDVKTLFNGPTAIAVASGDEVDLARGLVEETRTLKTLRIYGGVVRGRLIDANEITALAALPGRAQLQAAIVGTLEAPLSRLAAVFDAPLRELVWTLAARGAGTQA